ncbi:peptidase [Hyphomicrobium methylovorum]|uniref:PepSY-associated TM helix domain-containing protein n=1 Tax=Hyphomicrobium methylovorum TaxID=84 RepID=UPI0015E6C2CD|nr:PepSY-associated TM helix domain-containing protein [Hyphomicrobium methylovorum]MBA2124725.1 peptidase [Hyphomicrobium methylovorum]
MTNKAMRRWVWVHKWSSLISTVFLLMLCITGLPLIFHEEIDELLHDSVKPVEQTVTTAKPATLDQIAASAMSHFPGKAIQFLFWDEHEPNVTWASINEKYDGDPSTNVLARFDANTAQFLDAPDFSTRFTAIMLRLHTDFYLGLGGKLFLGLMGFLFVIALISGVVVYGPPMRKLNFGTIRFRRTERIRWLDLHNLLGIAAVAWLVVVGFTGVINTWADLVIKIWQFYEVTDMVGDLRDRPRPEKLASIDTVVKTAQDKLPDMKPRFIAYPGNMFSAPSHFMVFMAGRGAVTSRLLQPVLVDAATGEFVETRPMPWYVSTLLLSQPLHFGDYGGLTLRIIWAILDVIAIIVLISGLYLWKGRRAQQRAERPSRDARLATE